LKLESLVPQRDPLEVTIQGLREWVRLSNWPAPSFLLNLVTDIDGNFFGLTGSSRDISNEIDRQVLLGIRESADGILTTAKTARAEAYRRSALAPLALISRSGDFDGIPAVYSEDAGPVSSQVFLLVPSRLVRATRKRIEQPWVRILGIGSGSVFRITLALTRVNWRRVVVESGPEFSSWLIREFGIKYLNLTVVSSDLNIDVDSTKNALEHLGVQGGTLETAHRIDGTIVTRWSDLYAPTEKQRRGNRFGTASRIA
jgi:riboflavin biosynthesis pyrimidine reductase